MHDNNITCVMLFVKSKSTKHNSLHPRFSDCAHIDTPIEGLSRSRLQRAFGGMQAKQFGCLSIISWNAAALGLSGESDDPGLGCCGGTAASESWGLKQHPHPWRSRAGGGAVHSITSLTFLCTVRVEFQGLIC